MRLGPTLPQGGAARQGLATDARKHKQVAEILRSHASMLCFSGRYANVEDDKLICALVALMNNKWG